MREYRTAVPTEKTASPEAFQLNEEPIMKFNAFRPRIQARPVPFTFQLMIIIVSLVISFSNPSSAQVEIPLGNWEKPTITSFSPETRDVKLNPGEPRKFEIQASPFEGTEIASITFTADGQKSKTFDINFIRQFFFSSQKESWKFTWDEKREYTVVATATATNGKTADMTWSVTVEDSPPKIIRYEPTERILHLNVGDDQKFYVDAESFAKLKSIVFLRDDDLENPKKDNCHVGCGADDHSVVFDFPKAGNFIVSAIVTSRNKLTSHVIWQVNVRDDWARRSPSLADAGSIDVDETDLLANYPNPFNPETWIPYKLAKASDVKIIIYDAKGFMVRTLVLGHQSAGYYTSRSRAAYWDGRNTLGEQVASGIYFYQLQADKISPMRKMLILK